jgi:hypothetical protein
MKLSTIIPCSILAIMILTFVGSACYVLGKMQPSPEEKAQADYLLVLSELSEKADSLPDSPEKVRVIKGLTILEAVKF